MGVKKVKHWRDSTDYRSEFFRKNPGLVGCIWFCAYCGVPLKGKHRVQVDHVVPPSLVSRKTYRRGRLVKNTSLLSRTLNSSMNLVAACPKCNLTKSDRVGLITTRGIVGKITQTITSKTPRLLRAVTFVAGSATAVGLRLITLPFSLKVSGFGKFVLILLLILAIFYLTR